MLDLTTPEAQATYKMVKNKRDLKSPRRNRSFTGSRSGARLRQSIAGNRPAGNIRVVIRVRPFNERENTPNNRNVIKIVDKTTIVFDPKEDDEPFFYHGVPQKNRDIMKKSNKNLNFTFDQVFGNEANNEIVFEFSTKSLIESLMNGYNCSVFVYGATGAGKTHTMLGREQDPGITFLTLMELFKKKEELEAERDFEIGITYLEVYNENVQDLLCPGPSLSLREDGKYGVIVAGIKMQKIEATETVFELLEQGNRNRTQHPTDANAESSRSHAVFQVYLRMKFKATNEIRISKLSMIDLAGSERGAATGFSGARFTEGANINKSLLALGNCINSLADGNRHVPYRDSKLTRLLKDSLGGNCQTVMIANVSPSAFNYEDTYNTLKYAMRAKKIKASIKKNVVVTESSLAHYMQLVEELTKENEELKLKLALAQKECETKMEQQQQIPEIEPAPVIESEPVIIEDSLDQLKFAKLYEEKKQLEQRILQLESANNLAALRKQLKQETQSRLSGICTDNSEKVQCRMRLENAVDRLDRQTVCIEEDIAQTRLRSDHVDIQIQELLDKNSGLKIKCDVQDAEILCMKATNKAEHLQKVSDFLSGELRVRDQIIGRFSEVLQPCFLQLRGHGFATEALTAKYQALIRHLQGIRTVSFEEDSDSGISSTTVEQEDDAHTPNRKLSINGDLNNTFVIPEQKTSNSKNLNTKVFIKDEVIPNVCAEQIMYRVTKPSVQETSKVHPLAVHQLHVPNKRTANMLKSPLVSAKSSRPIPSAQKENLKINSRYHPVKLTGKRNPSLIH
ncbi:hypothetical protein FQR65_LT07954 [Abscondita terminalis]|nr:hypothetical protein FQR65_LT07954 [Abscondita terminalis]